MKEGLRARPEYLLTRHFLDEFLAPDVLGDAGVEPFRRVVLGVLAAIIAFGLLLARIFIGKYSALSARSTSAPYFTALLGDDALTLALPMWVVAAALVVSSRTLLPNDADFRILMTLPITKRAIFIGKILALVLFDALFAGVAVLGMIPLVLAMSISHWGLHSLASRGVAYAMAALSACAFTIIAVTALHGCLMISAARHRIQTAATVVRTGMLFVLVLLLPLMAQLPASGALVGSGSRWQYVIPPMWFLGLERFLLGETDAVFVRLIQVAALATGVAVLVALGCYSILYLKFGHIPARSPVRKRGSLAFAAARGANTTPEHQPFAAVYQFVWATLKRSALHQGILVGLSACGAAFVANRLLAVDTTLWTSMRGAPGRALVSTVFGAPFVLAFTMTVALKAALVLPFEPRSNWVFRLTEHDETRPRQLQAVDRVVALFGVGLPLALTFPFEWVLVGPKVLVGWAIAVPYCMLFALILFAGWRRVPFTCSYLPGKRNTAHTAFLMVLGFAAFTSIGAALVEFGIGRPLWSITIGASLLLMVLVLRRYRREGWGYQGLLFEDELPDQVPSIRLSAD